jgi:galactonate dehydratase
MTSITSRVAQPEDSETLFPRIVSIETVRSSLQPNAIFVLVHGADGQVGVGETFYGAASVEAYVHEIAALALQAPGRHSPARVSGLLSGYVGYSGSGTEVRGNSAIDIALWDLLAKQSNRPLRELLGGPFVESIEIYNTCAGNDYVRSNSQQSSNNWGLPLAGRAERYDDLWRFLNEPARLARDLVDEGYRGMKVWPFDLAAEASGGDHRADLKFGLGVLDAIREEVGDSMDLYVELHSLWQPRGAERLLRALEPYGLAWAEDPIRSDRNEALAVLREGTSVPIALGENVGAGYNSYKPLLDARSMDIAIIDAGWSGGITTAMRTAALADQYGVPVALHDCTGPVSLAVATHLVTAVPNGHVQEVARSFYHGWYGQVSEGFPGIADGRITPSAAPGHGVTLRPEMLLDPSTIRRVTAIES